MIKTARRKTLPALSPKVPAELRPLFAAMAEILETGEGVRGDKLDRKLTLRDLLDGGIAKLKVPGNPEAGITQPAGPQNMAVPPRPTGFAADGSFFGMIHLSWDAPYKQYNNHSFANIYRSVEDNFATASVIGREPGMFYSDLVRNDATIVDDPLNLPGYYYWITFSSGSNVEGAPNSPSGTYAQPLIDTTYLLGQLSGQLSESQLSKELSDRIDLIDAPKSMAGSVAARIDSERTERVAASDAQAIDISTLFVRSGDAFSAIETERDARIEDGKQIAKSIENVQTSVGENTSSIQQQAQSINGLSAQYTIKTDVNGYVAGYGVYNDGATADFAVLANRFFIATPGAPDSAIKPFMLINGVNYLDTAVIREGSIESGKLGPITFGKIFDDAGTPITTVGGKLRADMLDVDSLRVGNQNISGDITSSNYVPGESGWKLSRDGGLEFNSTIPGYGRVQLNNNGLYVYDNVNTFARVEIGRLL